MTRATQSNKIIAVTKIFTTYICPLYVPLTVVSFPFKTTMLTLIRIAKITEKPLVYSAVFWFVFPFMTMFSRVCTFVRTVLPPTLGYLAVRKSAYFNKTVRAIKSDVRSVSFRHIDKYNTTRE